MNRIGERIEKIGDREKQNKHRSSDNSLGYKKYISDFLYLYSR